MRRSADLFVPGVEPLPDILRIPSSLAVIFPPCGFPRQRNSIAADPLTAKTPKRWATRSCNSVVCLHQGAPLPVVVCRNVPGLLFMLVRAVREAGRSARGYLQSPALKPAARASDTLETVRHAAAIDPRVADITLVPAAGSAAIPRHECVRPRSRGRTCRAAARHRTASARVGANLLPKKLPEPLPRPTGIRCRFLAMLPTEVDRLAAKGCCV